MSDTGLKKHADGNNSHQVWSTCDGPSAVDAASHLILATSSQCWQSHMHFTDEGTKGQRGDTAA